MQKRLVMLATDHSAQIIGLGKERNSGLKERLEWLKSHFNWQVVLEEWSDKHAGSVAREFAGEAQLQWTSIGTPDEKRFKTFTGPVNFPGNDGTVQPVDWNAPSMHEYGPFENQDARENQMTENISSEMRNYEVGLLIVGLAHLHSMFEKLRKKGFEIVAYSWSG